MITAHALRRGLIVGLLSLTAAFVFTTSASAETSTVSDDIVVVSSTELGLDAFTMTVSNIGDLTLDLDLPPPGVVSSVVVDFGSYDGRWTINRLVSGSTATMTGRLRQPA